MAPQAPEVAAFEKNCRPDARPVMYGIALYIEYHSHVLRLSYFKRNSRCPVKNVVIFLYM
jgi:hypothetical protein